MRIVCATNRDPVSEVAEGRFREDLFYRLNVIPLHLPPLRERGGDVIPIARALLERIAREEGRDVRGLSERSEAWIERHDWPGNVRELQNVVLRAVVTSKGPIVDIVPAHLPSEPEIRHPSDDGQAPCSCDANASAAALDFAGMTMADVERLAIEQALARYGGNIVKAARALAISPSTIYRKIERWAV